MIVSLVNLSCHPRWAPPDARSAASHTSSSLFNSSTFNRCPPPLRTGELATPLESIASALLIHNGALQTLCFQYVSHSFPCNGGVGGRFSPSPFVFNHFHSLKVRTASEHPKRMRVLSEAKDLSSLELFNPQLLSFSPLSPLTSHESPVTCPLQICTFIFNNFQDAPPATPFFSNFCIVARRCTWGYPFLIWRARRSGPMLFPVRRIGYQSRVTSHRP